MGTRFRPLNENVANEDAFSDGTHREVAQSLCSLIMGSSESVTIGLEGKWGSGKTTVLQLLKNELDIATSDNEKILFFSFDAWAHEGDPLRRIFLESLADHMPPDPQDDKFKKLRKEISGKHKTIGVTTNRQASRIGIALTLSTMCVPIGAAILSVIDKTKVVMPFSEAAQGIHWMFSASLFLLGMPLFATVFWFVLTIGKNRKWAFMKGSTTDDYTQDVTGEAEKTSIEFEQYFKEILSERVGPSCHFQKAVIVLDNIDRLSKEHIRNVWATMQSFFQHRNSYESGSDSFAKSIWFIIPYDRAVLSEALDDRADATAFSSQPLSSGEILGPPPKQHKRPSLTVLEKSIQVTAEVPEPAMTGWSQYLDCCIEKALESWPRAEQEAVKATCHTCLASLTHSPTPRRLRSLVNQIGFNGMRWLGTLGTDSIVIYSWLRLDASAEEMRSNLLGHNSLPLRRYDDPIRIRHEIAAMLFGLPVDRAMQMLLGENISKALKPANRMEIEDKDSDVDLEGLLEMFGNGFWIAWKAEWPKIAPTESHDHEWLIALTINIQKQLGNFSHKIIREISQIRKTWMTSRNEWDISQYEYSDSVSVIATWFPGDSNFLEHVEKSLTSSLKTELGKGVETGISPKIALQIDSIGKALKKHQRTIKPVEYEELNAKNWAAWSFILSKENLEIPFVFPPQSIIEELVNPLTNKDHSIQEPPVDALIRIAAIYPNSERWSRHIDIMLYHPDLIFSDEKSRQISELFINLLVHGSGAVSNKLRERLKESSVLTSLALSSVNSKIIPSICLLSAVAYRERLHDSEGVPPFIISFWQSGENKAIAALNSLYPRIDMVTILSQLAEFEGYETAKLALKRLRESKVGS